MTRPIRMPNLPRALLHPVRLLLWCALCACCIAAEPVGGNYTPPRGFNGLTWGAPLSALGAVKLARANIVTDSNGRATQQRCMENPGGCAGWSPSDQDVEGRGSFAVAEYSRDSDSNPWAASGIALQTATYVYCDEWQGGSAPANVKQQLRLCGARIFYRSDTGAELAARPAGYTSNHDRLLRHLIGEFGPPDGYRMRRGEVTVGPILESLPDAATAEDAGSPRVESEQGVLRHRWCGLHDTVSALVPACPATVTLLFNHETGWGMVIMATAVMYKFAHARHATHDENNELYLALISGDPTRPTNRRANACLRTTGSLLCTGRMQTLSDKERQRFEP